MIFPEFGRANVDRSHAIISALQSLYREQKKESAQGGSVKRSRRMMDLEFQAHRLGASGEAIKHAVAPQNPMVNRLKAIFGFYADLNASRAKV